MTTYLLSRSKCSSSQCSNWERRKQVIDNINNLISSIAYCFENDISYSLEITLGLATSMGGGLIIEYG